MFGLILEVMDKIPSVVDNWLFFLSLGASRAYLCYRRLWSSCLVLPITTLFLWLHWSDLHREFREAILREAGPGYFTHSYAAMISGCALICLGILANRRKSMLAVLR